MKKVAIVGGGLAGLVAGIELAKKGVPCILYEKKKFPFHRVCGEYVSNEAIPFLKNAGLFPGDLNPSKISDLVLSSVRGQTATMPLDLGGFGISRFSFDNFLAEKARAAGVEVREGTEVMAIARSGNRFTVATAGGTADHDLVIGAFGKRSRLDIQLNRRFIRKSSPYVGVKYHAKTDHPHGVIALHNFAGGYCGVVNIENGLTNICYLAERRLLQRYRSVEILEKETLSANPLLSLVLRNADYVNRTPLVINEISFATKGPVENGILMAGDAAGMITPLCGNGMAMAIHAASILVPLVLQFCTAAIDKTTLESQYEVQWKKNFAGRLRTGRAVQRLFGSTGMSDLAIRITRFAPMARLIMKNTHGRPF